MSLKVESAFVLAAGRGERLRPLTDKTPKPLLPVKGKPILDYVLRHLSPLVKDFGLKRVVLNAWHLGDQIEAYARDRKNSFGFDLLVSRETELLGTGGGLKKALSLLYPQSVGDLLMVNGDCLWTGQLTGFIRAALEDPSSQGSWWLAPEEADQTPIATQGNRIVGIGKLWQDSKAEGQKRGCFTGIQLIKDLDSKALPEKGCIIRNYWLAKLQQGMRLRGDFEHLESWMDLGTPTRYERVRD